MLTPQDHAILRFEHRHPRHDSAWEKAVLDTFGWGRARHLQHVNRLANDPDALKAYPQLIYRIRRVLETRRAHAAQRLMK